MFFKQLNTIFFNVEQKVRLSQPTMTGYGFPFYSCHIFAAALLFLTAQSFSLRGFSHVLFLSLLILPVFLLLSFVFLNYAQSWPFFNFVSNLKKTVILFFSVYSMIFFTLFGVLFTLNNSVRSSYLNLTATVQTTFIFLHDNINFTLCGLNFDFYLDVLSFLFMGLSFFLIALCILFLWPTIELEKNILLYFSQLILLIFQLQITFSSANLLVFFIAFESLLIPMVIMITIWGSPNRRQANNYLVFYTVFSAIPMLLAIFYIYQKYATLNITLLSSLVSWSVQEQFFLWLAFFLAFAVKTPMVPFHIWLPKAHVDAPTVSSVILAGLLLKIGLVGFIRILLPLFLEATHFLVFYIAVLATIGVLYSSLITLRQIDMKRIIAYSSVAHMNMSLVCLCSLNSISIQSTIFLMLSHGFIASGLFFLVGFLYNRFHVRLVSYFGGLATLMPVMTIFFFYFSLANMAFPFTSGFIAEFLLLLSISSTNFFLGFLNATSMLVTTIYTLLLFGRVFLGELKPAFQHLVMQTTTVEKNSTFLQRKISMYDVYYYELIILISLVIPIFIGGVYPQIILTLLNDTNVLVVLS
jgi:proton-translocating NADH-quinone oxidoreductase chain M